MVTGLAEDPFALRRPPRALAWALAASVALHLLLIAGTPRWVLPFMDEEPEVTVLQALIANPAPPPAATAKVAPRPARTAARPPAPRPAEEAPAEPAPPPDTGAAPSEVPAARGLYARRAQQQPPAEVLLPRRAELQYALFKGADGFRVGRVSHSWELTEERYRLRSVLEATGLVSLFYGGQMVQESEGLLTAQGLRPQRYLIQRGSAERSERADFDWEAMQATLSAGGEARLVPLLAGTQDPLSFLHQFAFVPQDIEQYALLIAGGRKIASYEVQVLGRPTLDTEAGPIQTLHLRRQSGEGESSIEIWLAPEMYLLPVKLRLRDRKGDLLEQVLTAARVQ